MQFDRRQIVISCEHASARVPANIRKWFTANPSVMSTHRAYDIGAADIAKHLAAVYRAPLFLGEVTRLVCDLNRSHYHRTFHSEFLGDVPEEVLAKIVARYYTGYRQGVNQELRRIIQKFGRVLHLSVHSFTPALHGQVRNADFGYLYDPSRPLERKLVDRWEAGKHSGIPLRTRRNYPYRGTSDGITSNLRRVYSSKQYVGIEFEMNQKLLGTAAQRLEMFEWIRDNCPIG